jgi:hypothetical protein
MKPNSDEILDIWTDFTQALRPEIDSICFYPISMLPISKGDVAQMLIEQYQWVKNEAKEFTESNNIKKTLTETTEDLDSFPDFSTLFLSVAINVGYLAKFSTYTNEKYLTKYGYQLMKMGTSDGSTQSIVDIFENAPKTDPEKEHHLLVDYFLFVERFSTVSGFDIRTLFNWVPIMRQPVKEAIEKEKGIKIDNS